MLLATALTATAPGRQAEARCCDRITVLGWNIRVYRQETGREDPADWDTGFGDRVAVWQAGLWGLRWIDDLVKQGRAVDLKGNGYPMRYSARVADLIPVIEQGPPFANEVWICDPGDILGPAWDGKTVFHEGVAKQCDSEEWLLVEAWDES